MRGKVLTLCSVLQRGTLQSLSSATAAPFQRGVTLQAAASCKLQLPVISELLPSPFNLSSHLSQPHAASWPRAGAVNPPCGVMKSLLPSCMRRCLAPMYGHRRDGEGGQAPDRSALN